MKAEDIDLRKVYSVLKTVLGSDHYIVTDLVKRILVSNKVESFQIDYSGTIAISPEFCETYIEDESFLATLILHEIHHQILGDTKWGDRLDRNDKEYNIKALAANAAMDCRINAALARLFKSVNCESNLRSIYKKIIASEETIPLIYMMFKDEPTNGMMIQQCISDRARILYDKTYSSNKISSFQDLYIEILEYLRKNPPPDMEGAKNMLIGSHMSGEDGDGEPGPSEDQKEEILQVITDALRNQDLKQGDKAEGRGQDKEGSSAGKQAGKDGSLAIHLIKELENRDERGIDSAVLKRLAVRSIANNIMLASRKRVGKWTSSPVIPTKFAKSDFIRLVAGHKICLWKHHRWVYRLDPMLVPIYFDVSGSMTHYIPKVLDLIINIDEDINHVWCFSTEVHKHTIQELKARQIKTTGGTSFNAVVDHAVRSKFKAIMVITDGEDDVRLSSKHPEIDTITTVLVPGSRQDNWFSRHYQDTHELEDIITE